MQSVWLGFLQPRSEAGKNSRDAIGISLVRSQNASSFDRQIFINTQFVNELFNPPIRAVDDDGGKKRQKMDDGEVGEAAKQYSTSYAFSLVSPILIEIDRLVNDAIAEDRKCPENTALLINTVIKRMEYGSDCNNAASLRAKMKKLECEQRDHSRIVRNIAGAVTDMRRKGNNSAMQKHVLHARIQLTWGCGKRSPCYEVAAKAPKVLDLRLRELCEFLEVGGALPALQADTIPVIVGAYGGRLVIVTGLPQKLDKATKRQVNGATFSYKNNEVVLEVQPLRQVDKDDPLLEGVELGPTNVAFVRNGAYKKAFLLKLTQVVLPQFIEDLAVSGFTRSNCLGIKLLPTLYVGAPQVFLVHSTTLATLQDAEQVQIALGD